MRFAALPFREQIDFFGAKAGVTTQRWTDVWRDAHDTSFMVAAASTADLVDDLQGAVRAAVEDGETLAQFRKRFSKIVDRHGWSYHGSFGWRSRLIYETNLRVSHAAGRRRQQVELAEAGIRPYWMYRHSDAVTTPRPLHLAWNGLVLRYDDPWWDTHYGPNGWGCRCSVIALSERDLRRRGLSVGVAPTDGTRIWVDKRTGERHVIPRGIDPGWDYAPGATSLAQHARTVARDSALRLPPTLRDELLGILDAPTPAATAAAAPAARVIEGWVSRYRDVFGTEPPSSLLARPDAVRLIREAIAARDPDDA